MKRYTFIFFFGRRLFAIYAGDMVFKKSIHSVYGFSILFFTFLITRKYPPQSKQFQNFLNSNK